MVFWREGGGDVPCMDWAEPRFCQGGRAATLGAVCAGPVKDSGREAYSYLHSLGCRFPC